MLYRFLRGPIVFLVVSFLIVVFLILTAVSLFPDPKAPTQQHISGPYVLSFYKDGTSIPYLLFSDEGFAWAECNMEKDTLSAVGAKALKKHGVLIVCSQFYGRTI